MKRRDFLTFPIAGIVIGGAAGGAAPQPAGAATHSQPVRKATELTWYVTPPGATYSDPLNLGRKVGLRWSQNGYGLWAAIALLYRVGNPIPREVMDIARHRLLEKVQAWERGTDDQFGVFRCEDYFSKNKAEYAVCICDQQYDHGRAV